MRLCLTKSIPSTIKSTHIQNTSEKMRSAHLRIQLMNCYYEHFDVVCIYAKCRERFARNEVQFPDQPHDFRRLVRVSDIKQVLELI